MQLKTAATAPCKLFAGHHYDEPVCSQTNPNQL